MDQSPSLFHVQIHWFLLLSCSLYLRTVSTLHCPQQVDVLLVYRKHSLPLFIPCSKPCECWFYFVFFFFLPLNLLPQISTMFLQSTNLFLLLLLLVFVIQKSDGLLGSAKQPELVQIH